MKKVLAALLAIVAVSGVTAQGVYKLIGPDGKVTFSDQPPADGKSKSTVLSPPAARPQTAAAPNVPPAALEEATSTRPPALREAKKASRASPAITEVASTEKPIDEALLKALHTVAGNKLLVQHMRDTCTQARPTAFGKYADAADHWNERNGTVMTQQQRVMGELLTTDQRQKFDHLVKARIDELTRPHAAAAPAALFKWCDHSIGEINSGVMDLHNRQEVSAPLMSYRSR
jgi:Domain of unknown function (DUF4124)